MSTPGAHAAQLRTEVLHAKQQPDCEQDRRRGSRRPRPIPHCCEEPLARGLCGGLPPRLNEDEEHQRALRHAYHRVAARMGLRYFSAEEYFPRTRLDLWSRDGVHLSDREGMGILTQLLWASTEQFLETPPPPPPPPVSPTPSQPLGRWPPQRQPGVIGPRRDAPPLPVSCEKPGWIPSSQAVTETEDDGPSSPVPRSRTRDGTPPLPRTQTSVTNVARMKTPSPAGPSQTIKAVCHSPRPVKTVGTPVPSSSCWPWIIDDGLATSHSPSKECLKLDPDLDSAPAKSSAPSAPPALSARHEKTPGPPDVNWEPVAYSQPTIPAPGDYGLAAGMSSAPPAFLRHPPPIVRLRTLCLPQQPTNCMIWSQGIGSLFADGTVRSKCF
ncbi:formin-like protein 5 [Acanthopagrus latus]|uniref:formin-like protein 5 n=1 Tax=Acanthopagrus latus TaxID=8177 RepID=UPI00187BCE40|nr:formin-like protein 5 [Acanthopagrus latus]